MVSETLFFLEGSPTLFGLPLESEGRVHWDGRGTQHMAKWFGGTRVALATSCTDPE